MIHTGMLKAIGIEAHCGYAQKACAGLSIMGRYGEEFIFFFLMQISISCGGGENSFSSGKSHPASYKMAGKFR